MKQPHATQLGILQKLLFSNGLRYTQMKPDPKMDNNQFDFHLDTLIGEGHIEKDGKMYRLTSQGKEYANRLDTDEIKMLRQAKLGTAILVVKGAPPQREFLIYTRLKQPFYGCQGCLTGKIPYGEQVVATAKRELLEETGLQADITVAQLRHYRVYHHQTGELVEDKFMFFCVARHPAGTLISDNQEGHYEWVKESELAQRVTKPFEDMDSFFRDVALADQSPEAFTFMELDHQSSKF